MRVLVCGGRGFDQFSLMKRELDEISISCLIQGGAPGADSLARRYANARGLPVMEMQANWTRYGRKAGPIRNQWMIDHGRPNLVVAFPGGFGTRDMVRRADEAGVPVKFCGTWAEPITGELERT